MSVIVFPGSGTMVPTISVTNVTSRQSAALRGCFGPPEAAQVAGCAACSRQTGWQSRSSAARRSFSAGPAGTSPAPSIWGRTAHQFGLGGLHEPQVGATTQGPSDRLRGQSREGGTGRQGGRTCNGRHVAEPQGLASPCIPAAMQGSEPGDHHKVGVILLAEFIEFRHQVLEFMNS